MSSNIKVQRICQYCGNEFTARTTVTKFCSHDCSRKAYKERNKTKNVNTSTKLNQIKSQRTIDEIKVQEFLTVKEVAVLLNCSVRTIYYYIETGAINAVNLGQRITRVKRSDIDKLFEQTRQENNKPTQNSNSECYSLQEVQKKYKISEKALYDFIKRNNIPKYKKGRYAYVPKVIIDSLLT